MAKKKSRTKKAADPKAAEKSRKEALAVTARNLARIDAAERGEPVSQATPDGSAKRGARGAGKGGKAKAPKAKKEKRTSALEAAVQILRGAKEPMNATALVEAMQKQKLWSPPQEGKTPHATLYSAMLREIQKKGREARFQKVERGLFILRKGA